MSNGKFCKDCKHYTFVKGGGSAFGIGFGDYSQCDFQPGPPLYDPVTGKRIHTVWWDIKEVRQDPTQCGLEGRWFELKQVPLKEKLFGHPGSNAGSNTPE